MATTDHGAGALLWQLLSWLMELGKTVWQASNSWTLKVRRLPLVVISSGRDDALLLAAGGILCSFRRYTYRSITTLPCRSVWMGGKERHPEDSLTQGPPKLDP